MPNMTCYAEGRGDEWEVVCIDLDLAVQGRSFIEVYDKMAAAIRDHIESAQFEAPEDAERLLHRKAPWHVRLRLNLGFLYHWFLHRRNGGESHGFTVACPA